MICCSWSRNASRTSLAQRASDTSVATVLVHTVPISSSFDTSRPAFSTK